MYENHYRNYYICRLYTAGRKNILTRRGMNCKIFQWLLLQSRNSVDIGDSCEIGGHSLHIYHRHRRFCTGSYRLFCHKMRLELLGGLERGWLFSTEQKTLMTKLKVSMNIFWLLVSDRHQIRWSRLQKKFGPLGGQKITLENLLFLDLNFIKGHKYSLILIKKIAIFLKKIFRSFWEFYKRWH